MSYFWWGRRGNSILITLRSERVKRLGEKILFELETGRVQDTHSRVTLC